MRFNGYNFFLLTVNILYSLALIRYFYEFLFYEFVRKKSYKNLIKALQVGIVQELNLYFILQLGTKFMLLNLSNI